jgi:hypothetical protein
MRLPARVLSYDCMIYFEFVLQDHRLLLSLMIISAVIMTTSARLFMIDD